MPEILPADGELHFEMKQGMKNQVNLVKYG